MAQNTNARLGANEASAVSFSADRQRVHSTNDSFRTEFEQSIAAAGIGSPAVIADGKLHRFRGHGDKPGSLACWYVLFTGDRPAGAFGSWRLQERCVWRAGSTDRLTTVERRKLAEAVQRAKSEAKAEQEKAQAAARAKAVRIWTASPPASPDHPYLVRKRIEPHHLRQYRDALLVPLHDEHGVLHNLQFIAADGTKRFLRSGRVRGLASAIGNTEHVERLIVCEGISTGATLHAVSGSPVLVAMNAGNMKLVAIMARHRWPDADITVAADNDVKTKGNPGLTAARQAAAAIGGRLAVPEFPEGVVGTDFNDLHLASLNSGVLRVPGVPASNHAGLSGTPQESVRVPGVPDMGAPA